MLIPSSRDNNNLRQKIWALFVCPYAKYTRNPGSPPTNVFSTVVPSIRILNPNNQQSSWQSAIEPQNKIDTTTPGSLSSNDHTVWILTMLDSSYYSLLQRAKKYIYEEDLVTEYCMICEVVPADFNLTPTI